MAIGGRPLASESGLILIDKPRGITSFGVVSRLRKLTGVRRIGHTGTLDPFADGLLPVCIGRATAAVQFMDGYDKTYRLGVEFGRATDTQDLTGQTVFEHKLTAEEAETLRSDGFAALRKAVAALPGEHRQKPPMYSAVKVDGRPLYEYARQGFEIDRRERTVRIDAAELEDVRLENGLLTAQLRIECSKGTYMRTIADDLGRTFGFGAHAASLTRLRCGPFNLDQAVRLDDLFAWRDDTPDQPSFVALLRDKGLLLAVDRAFDEFPRLILAEDEARRLINGQLLARPAGQLPDGSGEHQDKLNGHWSAWCHDRLIGIVRLQPADGQMIQIKAERVLTDLADFQQA